MFERYTEKARRVIFFARYEAAETFYHTINPPHIFLGILREKRALFAELSENKISADAIRDQVLNALSFNKELRPPTADVPLSNASKRVFGYAAEEAKRRECESIETEDILVGILLEEDTVTRKVLTEAGIELEGVRKKIASRASRRFVAEAEKVDAETAEKAKRSNFVALICSNCPDEIAERAFLDFEMTCWEDVSTTAMTLQTHRPAVFAKLGQGLRGSWRNIVIRTT